ncbi:hypothetical protein RINTHH_6860 [Richelia intracellularis HH01]|uniref:Uncharacterized protein n=1 Tax=Richelia intracellularis HH01 TaxID=1165094 RepID=M1X4X3_9NOST|nr:hypothetical protein RINTHH_6860 [Richelia intracellularis HH01]
MQTCCKKIFLQYQQLFTLENLICWELLGLMLIQQQAVGVCLTP